MTGKRRHQINEESSEDSDFSYDNLSNATSNPGNVEQSELQPRKRGRGPSKRPCLNRNALMARANRQKKKKYVEHIESKLMHYRQEIKELTTKNQKQCIDLKRLTAEVSYLKNILNNNSSITSLLKSINEILSRGRRKGKEGESAKFICEKEKEADGKGNLNNPFLQMTLQSDHNYSSLHSDELFNFEGVNYNPDNGQVSIKESSSQESSVKIYNELNKSPVESIDNIDLGISDTDLDQLNSIDLFSQLSDDLDDNEPIDFFKAQNSPVESLDLFNNLDNNGICVHVNPRRISLEFCSACHVNNANLD
ncbi:uncharacterized protein LOC123267698 isoform X1 [Cotesia glomerata]|uniref:uncharacterized protein LOC123267698 isoform X1 n=1 Tax=Cotesia glomerata TaxID=32391 RepID=UPI001D018ADB|nr:uncharacterized protein LOC123267698 isoform X1 [Cotesia glomerata]XP_044588425.1 uncharacterized protein LOC123267698 isoform X1 [Cotesia glomerata]